MSYTVPRGESQRFTQGWFDRQGYGFDVSSRTGRTNVEYDNIACKVATAVGCSKEAFEFLEAVIQNDNASPQVPRPLVVQHADGTANVWYDMRAISLTSKADISSAICEVKKDDSRCPSASAPSYVPPAK